MPYQRRVLIPPGAGASVACDGLGVVFKLSGEDTGGAFAIVEHPLRPGALAGPPHTHANEDEFSVVLAGEIGVQVGDEVYQAPPGTYIAKPRGVPHTFWNAGTEPARLIEIISPAGFERYFEELAGILTAGGPPDFNRIMALAGRYGLTLHMEQMAAIMEKYNVAPI